MFIKFDYLNTKKKLLSEEEDTTKEGKKEGKRTHKNRTKLDTIEPCLWIESKQNDAIKRNKNDELDTPLMLSLLASLIYNLFICVRLFGFCFLFMF